jgi:hypothetical protein
MRTFTTLASLLALVATAAAGPSPAVVSRDDARRELQVWMLPAEAQASRIQPAAIRAGKLIVRNRSGYSADVYLAEPADEPDWLYVGEPLPTGFKLIVRNLPRRTTFLMAAEETDNYDGLWDWGPRSFVMRKRFRWTLLGDQ